ncbi:MAG TPA: BatD family protein [Flavobacterium sp.]|jgi:hypothetical protein|nr:BatD family protein [Flavobacterium sp.]
MKTKLYILFLLISIQSVVAQVQFEARASKQSLAQNETFRVDFIMNADGDNFTPPSFEGFRVVGGPSQQVSQSWINGKSSFNKIYSYFLMPARRGNLTIRQASIEINGETYKTSPLSINVTAAVERPREPGDNSITADEAIHLIAEVSKTTPYINEPITVVYKLYFSMNIGISNWRELEKPKYNDFWSQNIDIKRLVAEEGTFNNQRYRYVVLRKTVLYPQKSGKLTIEPLALDIDVQLPTGRRNMFGQMQIVEDHKRVSAGAKTINVKPLPENGRPEDFSGAVGKFDFKVTPSRTSVKHGESIDLVVSVSGTGNLKLFNLPKPVVPTALEMYDPVHKQQVNTPLSGMTGSISDTYTVVPQFQGNYPIKPMRFTYFDLGTRSYKTITSPEIMIRVVDGPGVGETNAPFAAGTAKQEIVVPQQFKFIKLRTNLVSTERKDFFGSATFYTMITLPFLLIPLIVLLKRRRDTLDSDVAGNKTRTSNRLAKKYLFDAKKNINNKELFYISLEKAMHNFLKAKLNIETFEMSKERITEILLARNANPDTVSEFINLTESCEFARYAPSSAGAINQNYEKAVVIISALEKQISK